MSAFIDQINQRAHNPKYAIDEVYGITDGKGNPIIYVAHPPATPDEIAAAERQLGFTLPPLLRQLYLEVGNGGFGPGYGLCQLPPASKRGLVSGALTAPTFIAEAETFRLRPCSKSYPCSQRGAG